jgi:hypothetical protein
VTLKVRIRRSEIAGFTTALVYVAIAMISFKLGVLPGRPIYDGFGPPAPYRWVTPPKNAQTQEKPTGGEAEVPMTDAESEGGDATTSDFQAQLLIPKGSVQPMKGETSAKIRVTPLDPRTQPDPPKGLIFDSNAYVFEGTYTKSGAAIKLAEPASLIMRYATAASDMYLLNAGVWQPVKAHRAGQSLQLFADVTTLGTYVAMGEPEPTPIVSPTPAARGFLESGRLFYSVLGGVFLVIFLLLLWYRFRTPPARSANATARARRSRRRRRRR